MEIKNYHKYICIFIEKESFITKIQLNKVNVGDIIHAEKLPFDFDSFWRTKGDEYYFSCKRNINVYGGFNISETEFRKYFIPIAEWRDKQIDKILED
jgi:hypothetical protein